MGEITPMVDALAVWAEERRVYERDIIDESSNRHYKSMVSEWSNPSSSNARDQVPYGTWGEPGELKHLSTQRNINHKEIPLVAASETGKV